MYDILLYDYDGTLADSSEGILSCFAGALKALGHTPPPKESLHWVIGPPLYGSFHDGIGLGEEEAQRAVELYREAYQSDGVYRFRLYPGMERLVQELHARHMTQAVVSAKPEEFVRTALESARLLGCFDETVGRSRQDADPSKRRQLLDALGRLGVPRQEYGRVLMVGDRHFDIDAARELGIAAAGVTWGFAEPGELEAAGAQYLVSTAAELEKIVLG